MNAGRTPRALGATLANESLPVVVYSAFIALLAVLVPQSLSSDGWLALVAGRVIANHGVPRHDTLAALTTGRSWVDQQWLGQLATYGLESLGGVRLLLVANVILVSSALVAAGGYARRRGARPATLALVLLGALLPFLVTTMNVRTQSFVYLPFVVLVAVLVRDRVSPRASLAVLAMLVVWANVHGSALLAAGLIVLRGAVGLSRSRRDKIAWVLLLTPWICLLVSPYHVHLIGYYHRTAFNSSFATYLSQWAPTTLSPISVSLLVLAFTTVWMLGRPAASYTPYERWLLGAAVLLALLAVRNWAFAALLFVMLTPHGFDRALRRRAPRPAPQVGAVVAVVLALGAIAAIASALGASTAKLTRNYPIGAAAAAATATASRPHAQVYAGIQFGDWLIWMHPELAGKLVFDVRYELLHASEVKRLALFDAGSQTDAPLGRPVAYVLDPNAEKDAVRGLGADVRTVYKTDHAVVDVVRNGQ